MQDTTKSFGDVAGSLSKNPLGIIALFIVLVYGFASLVTAFGGSLSESEKVTLVNFLALFPVLVLVVFAWLVSSHSNKLYGPSDYKNEENYIRTQFRKEKMPIPIMEEITMSENAFLESITLFFDGEYDEAILNLNKAINKYPNCVGAYILRGQAQWKLNKYDDAIQSFNSAIVLRPDDDRLLGKKADVLYIDGRYEEAIRTYDEAIRLNPNDAKISEELNKILEEERQIYKKIKKYEDRLKSTPNDAYILNSKAWMLYLLEKYDDSLQFVNKSLELDPNEADPWDTKGAVLVRLGRYDEAIESIDMSIELSPNTHYTWYHRGKALEGLGHTTEANAAFIKAKGMGFKGEYLGI